MYAHKNQYCDKAMKNRYFGKQNQSKEYNVYSREIVKDTISTAEVVLRSSFTIIAVLSILYCSLFYIPGFINQSQIVRFSSEAKVEPNENFDVTPVKWHSPYLDLLRLRRGYFKSGQTLEIDYILSERAELLIQVKRCKGPAIIEIFYCNVDETIEHTQPSSVKGKLTMSVDRSGFYRMKEFVQTTDGQNVGYSAVWRRK